MMVSTVKNGNDRLRKENRRRRIAYASVTGLVRHFTAKVSQNELQSFAAKVRSCQWMTSPQKFHKMNCKVSQLRPGLVSGCFAAKVSQNELQSFTAKVRSCQWMLHCKSFTKCVAKFRSRGPVLSVDASPQKFHKMNCKVSQQRSSLSVDACDF